MNVTDFLLCLKLQRGIGYVKLLKIARQLSSEVTLASLAKMQLPDQLKSASYQAYKDKKSRKMVECIKKQCQVISFFDEVYPERLRQIYQPPLLLFAQGDTSLMQKKIITIVGSRMATKYSWAVISKLVPNLVKNELVVASGLAKGVDAMAHQAALNNDGKTIAVVGNGLNYFYPAKNQEIQEQIRQKGLILSEYLPDTAPRPFRFPQRNRILAGLAQSVIVTEAKEKSGSLITANLALQENRNVYAVPGPITSQVSMGTNQLILAGATPLVDFELTDDF